MTAEIKSKVMNCVLKDVLKKLISAKIPNKSELPLQLSYSIITVNSCDMPKVDEILAKFD